MNRPLFVAFGMSILWLQSSCGIGLSFNSMKNTNNNFHGKVGAS